MTGKITVGTIQDTDGNTVASTYVTNGSAKAYAMTGNSGSTLLTTKLFNVSSLTDNAVGRMSVNFTSNFDSVNYSRLGTSNVNTAVTYYMIVCDDERTSQGAPYVVSTSTAPMTSITMTNAYDDAKVVHLIFHGDLA